jgi:hypothetical protein
MYLVAGDEEVHGLRPAGKKVRLNIKKQARCGITYLHPSCVGGIGRRMK